MLNRVRLTAAILMQFSAMFTTPSLSGRNFELHALFRFITSTQIEKIPPPQKNQIRLKKRTNKTYWKRGIW